MAVDLDGLDTLDDVGMGVIIGAAGRARRSGGDVVVVCSSAELVERFATTRLDRAVTVVPAITAIRRPLTSSATYVVGSDALGPGEQVALHARRPTTVGGLVPRPLLVLQRRLLGDEALQVGEAVGVEPAVVDRLAHRTPGLLVVLAVAEPALVHQLEHVGEGSLDAAARQPQRQRPHPRRVDQPAAAGHGDQLGGHGRVPTRWSPVRTAVVACTSAPTRAFTSVDLPTPLAPRNATVRPA